MEGGTYLPNRSSSWRQHQLSGQGDVELGSLPSSKPSSTGAVKGHNNNGFIDEGLGRESSPSNSSSVDKIRGRDENMELDRPSDNDSDADRDDLDLELSCCMRGVAKAQNGFSKFIDKNKGKMKVGAYVILVILYVAYFIAAIVLNHSTMYRVVFLIIITLVVVLFLAWDHIFAPKIEDSFSLFSKKLSSRAELIIELVITLVFFIGVLVVLFYWVDVVKNPSNLVSALGIITFIVLLFITSHSPQHVQWRTVLSGLMIQFVIGVIILKTKPGFCFFEYLGEQVSAFLGYTMAGVNFVFNFGKVPKTGGGERDIGTFATHVLSIVIFFSSFVAMLFHTGIMLYVIKKVAWVMGKLMKTTAGESLVAAANIFIGQSEAPLMIRPFLPVMTNSEIHSVMTSGFATVAGTVMGAYISFGARASHLICASIMSAPAALAMSKLSYPETKKSKTTFKEISEMKAESPYGNILEAFSVGATDAITLVAGIVANLIAFISLIAFANACLTYFGSRVEIENVLCDQLTINLIMAYIFIPLAWVMGVDWQDCREISELIGIKTVVNEFLAYEQLGELTSTRKLNEDRLGTLNGTYTLDYIKDLRFQMGCQNGTSFPDVMIEGTAFPSKFVSYRSEVIGTYALCGFANFGSIGIQLGALAAIAPSRKSDLSRIVLRAMVAGNVACFMTACIAGLLYDEAFETSGGNDCSVSWL